MSALLLDKSIFSVDCPFDAKLRLVTPFASAGHLAAKPTVLASTLKKEKPCLLSEYDSCFAINYLSVAKPIFLYLVLP